MLACNWFLMECCSIQLHRFARFINNVADQSKDTLMLTVTYILTPTTAIAAD